MMLHYVFHNESIPNTNSLKLIFVACGFQHPTQDRASSFNIELLILIKIVNSSENLFKAENMKKVAKWQLNGVKYVD